MSNNATLPETVVADSLVTCETSHGVEVHARLTRLGRHDVVFEVHSPATILQMSEVLSDLRIVIRDRPIYSGRAVIKSLISTGPTLLCEATLDDSLLEVDLFRLVLDPKELGAGFDTLLRSWGKTYRIRSEFKLAVADLQSFLHELRHWSEQLELGSSAVTSGNRAEIEHAAVLGLGESVIPCFNALFEKFELAAARIEPELQAAHAVYVRRQLNPLLLASPFLHRIFRKPLGYPGDYEMVSMILRDPVEGGSIFAKIINHWVLTQAPAVGHRNRIKLLTRRLEEETARIWNRGRPLRVFNLGCGPAREVDDFLTHSDSSHASEFTLLDFNEETLAHVRSILTARKQAHGRRTNIRYIKKSVAQMLKSPGREVGGDYDFVYCAGLFDYLPDRVCKRLLQVFYEMLAPGGLLLATNVDTSNPIQNMMHYVFEWNLIYRDARQFEQLAPDAAAPEDCRVTAETSGSNIFLEVRKPHNLT